MISTPVKIFSFFWEGRDIFSYAALFIGKLKKATIMYNCLKKFNQNNVFTVYAEKGLQIKKLKG